MLASKRFYISEVLMKTVGLSYILQKASIIISFKKNWIWKQYLSVYADQKKIWIEWRTKK